jgi:hypothetical protein
MPSYEVHLPKPHPKQQEFITSIAKRKIIRAGRRGGKTVGVGVYSVQRFLNKKRILYTVPTAEQVDRFWITVCRALYLPIRQGVFKKNETEHVIELVGTEQRIRAKTAWDPDSLRGDYGDELILDEFQLMAEDTWGVVGAPMMLDTNGTATFVYTPPSIYSRSTSKSKDPQHAAKMFRKFKELADAGDTRYAVFSFTSMDNPYLSNMALREIAKDMSSIAYRMEILAEDVQQAPGALWDRDMIERSRVDRYPDLWRVVVGVDPTATSQGDEAGIITCGMNNRDYFTLGDNSTHGSPLTWSRAAVDAYYRYKADCIVAEGNNGGEMVSTTIAQVDDRVPVKIVWASRGKAVRAEPISAIASQGRDHHVGSFPALEDELCLWVPGAKSPNRLDAKVWAITELSNPEPQREVDLLVYDNDVEISVI